MNSQNQAPFFGNVNGAVPLLKIILLVSVLLLAACTPTDPYRTALPKPPPECPLSSSKAYPTECQTSRHEHTKDYDLLFVEFDDQGLLYPTRSQNTLTTWPQQINEVMELLHELVQPYKDNISFYVFVHGWKHNASSEDENVQGFREALQAAALAEQASHVPHRVIGIYIAWRGLSATMEPFLELSFWERKATALYVAQGSVRHLLARLKGFQHDINCPQPSACSKRDPGRDPRPQARFIMIGHSFGGLILFNAISEALIDSLTPESGEPAVRFGDMVILLNPAFEASRYTPLHRIVSDPKRQFARYQAPILVSITSTADWATGLAFPFGRFINTLFEVAASPEESTAIKNTMGHVDMYTTHKLTASAQNTSVCQQWKDIREVDPSVRLQQMRQNLIVEEKNNSLFFGTESRPILNDHWVRNFCNGAVLTHVNYHPNSPIWNIQTDKSVMKDHDDIQGSVLTNFLRQLYKDSYVYPFE